MFVGDSVGAAAPSNHINLAPSTSLHDARGMPMKMCPGEERSQALSLRVDEDIPAHAASVRPHKH